MIFIITGFACLLTFIAVAAWSAGFRFAEKIGLVIAVVGAVPMFLSVHVLEGRSGVRLLEPGTERWLWVTHIGSGVLIVGGLIVFIGCSCTTWGKRKRIFPFLYDRPANGLDSPSREAPVFVETSAEKSENKDVRKVGE